MPTKPAQSKACCTIPPVVSSGYEYKGAYEDIMDMKTYVTGPSDATRGIIMIYDIFGFFDQTIQGADILATSHANTKYRVFMPDWFKHEPYPIEAFPANNPERKELLDGFFQRNPPQGVAKQLPEFVQKAKAKYPEIKSWGILGFCWGGKVVSLATSTPKPPFVVAGECHPAMVDPEDAVGIQVPIIMLASMNEDKDDVKKFAANLNVENQVETFDDQIHGWMAARSDLSDPRVKEEYTRGYETVLKFFGENWK